MDKVSQKIIDSIIDLYSNGDFEIVDLSLTNILKTKSSYYLVDTESITISYVDKDKYGFNQFLKEKCKFQVVYENQEVTSCDCINDSIEYIDPSIDTVPEHIQELWIEKVSDEIAHDYETAYAIYSDNSNKDNIVLREIAIEELKRCDDPYIANDILANDYLSEDTNIIEVANSIISKSKVSQDELSERRKKFDLEHKQEPIFSVKSNNHFSLDSKLLGSGAVVISGQASIGLKLRGYKHLINKLLTDGKKIYPMTGTFAGDYINTCSVDDLEYCYLVANVTRDEAKAIIENTKYGVGLILETGMVPEVYDSKPPIYYWEE